MRAGKNDVGLEVYKLDFQVISTLTKLMLLSVSLLATFS